MKIYKFKSPKTNKIYFTITGKETDTNFYNRKGKYIKELITNGNGKIFSPHIKDFDNIDYSKWDEINKENLPKSLKKSFDYLESWLNN